MKRLKDFTIDDFFMTIVFVALCISVIFLFFALVAFVWIGLVTFYQG